MGFGIIIKGEIYLNRYTQSDIKNLDDKIEELKSYIKRNKEKLLLMIGDKSEKFDHDIYDDIYEQRLNIFTELWENIEEYMHELNRLYLAKEMMEEDHEIIVEE